MGALEQIYQTVGKDYDLPDYDTFSKTMLNRKERQNFYNAISKDYDVPDFDSFSRTILPDLAAIPRETRKIEFDPEGEGYDYENAIKAGYTPDETGHWPSRVEDTGLLLKGRQHETWPELEKGEADQGYKIYKGEDGRYYSQPYKPEFSTTIAESTKQSSINQEDQIGSPWKVGYNLAVDAWGNAALGSDRILAGGFGPPTPAGSMVFAKQYPEIQKYQKAVKNNNQIGKYLESVIKKAEIELHPEDFPTGKYAVSPESWQGYLDPKRMYMTIANQSPLMASFVIANGVSGGLSTVLMGAVEGGDALKTMEEFEEQTGYKIPDEQKDLIYLMTGSINGALEKVGLEAVLGKLPGVKGTIAKILAAPITEAATEGLQEVNQILNERGYGNIDPQLWDRIKNASYGGFLLGLLGGGSSTMVEEISTRLRDDGEIEPLGELTVSEEVQKQKEAEDAARLRGDEEQVLPREDIGVEGESQREVPAAESENIPVQSRTEQGGENLEQPEPEQPSRQGQGLEAEEEIETPEKKKEQLAEAGKKKAAETRKMMEETVKTEIPDLEKMKGDQEAIRWARQFEGDADVAEELSLEIDNLSEKEKSLDKGDFDERQRLSSLKSRYQQAYDVVMGKGTAKTTAEFISKKPEEEQIVSRETERFKKTIGGKIVKDEETLYQELKTQFGYDEEKATQSAKVIDTVMDYFAKQTGKKKEDLYQENIAEIRKTSKFSPEMQKQYQKSLFQDIEKIKIVKGEIQLPEQFEPTEDEYTLLGKLERLYANEIKLRVYENAKNKRGGQLSDQNNIKYLKTKNEAEKSADKSIEATQEVFERWLKRHDSGEGWADDVFDISGERGFYGDAKDAFSQSGVLGKVDMDNWSIDVSQDIVDAYNEELATEMPSVQDMFAELKDLMPDDEYAEWIERDNEGDLEDSEIEEKYRELIQEEDYYYVPQAYDISDVEMYWDGSWSSEIGQLIKGVLETKGFEQWRNNWGSELDDAEERIRESYELLGEAKTINDKMVAINHALNTAHVYGNMMEHADISEDDLTRLSELGNSLQTLDTEPTLFQDQKADIFYSKLNRTIDEKMANAADPQTIRNLIQKSGIKQEEIDWSGIESFLEGKEKVSKKELQDYLVENQVRVEEVVKPNEVIKPYEAFTDEEIKVMYEENIGDSPDYNRNLTRQQMIDELVDIDYMAETESPNRTKFEQYTEPGGENYRELLLMLPLQTPEQKLDASLKKPGREGAGYAFTSSHFDEPNILAHIRFNERTDAGGNKVLFIEEIQSDWHQQGRKHGYKLGKKEYTPENTKIETDDIAQMHYLVDLNGLELSQLSFEESHSAHFNYNQIRQYLIKKANEGSEITGVPNAPFKKNWHELALKRALRWAAENGFDKVAWTTGEMQAERYDLSKQVDYIDLKKSPRPEYAPRMIEIQTKQGPFLRIGVDDSGKIENANAEAESFRGKQLDDVIGKELADKIMKTNLPVSQSPIRFEGGDLKVGGEGMKAFYDQMIPAAANKIGKKFGSRVEQINIGGNRLTADEDMRLQQLYNLDASRELNPEQRAEFAELEKLATDKIDVQSIPITPEMRFSLVNEGQPLFQGPKGATTFLADGSAIIHAFNQADVSTAIHEFSHVFLNMMKKYGMEKELNTVLNWTGNKVITRNVQEKFARGFERYLRDGKAPTAEMREVFEKFKEWLKEIYKKITGSEIDIKLSPEMRDLFDKMLGGEATRTVKERGVKKTGIKREVNTVGDWIKARMADTGQGILPEHLREHSISQTENQGVFLRYARKNGMGLDDWVATAVDEGIIPDIDDAEAFFVDALLNDKAILGKTDFESELKKEETEYYYNKAMKEGDIPEETSIEEFQQLMNSQVQKDIDSLPEQYDEEFTFFQQSDLFNDFQKKLEDEFIKEQAKKGIDVTKKTGFKSIEEREQTYKKYQEKLKEKGGQQDLFEEREQLTLFQKDLFSEDVLNEAEKKMIETKDFNRVKLQALIHRKIWELKQSGTKVKELDKKLKDYIKYLVVQYANGTLPNSLINRPQVRLLMNQVRKAQSATSLEKAFNQINGVATSILRNVTKRNIFKLAKIKPKKQPSGRMAGYALTPDEYEKLNDIRQYLKLSPEESFEKIQNYIKRMDEGEALENFEQEDLYRIQMFGGIKDSKTNPSLNKSLERLQEAEKELQQIVEEGRTKRMAAEDSRMRKVGTLRDIVRKVFSGGKKPLNLTDAMRNDLYKKAGAFRQFDTLNQNFEWLLDKLSRLDKSSKPLESLVNKYFVPLVYKARATNYKGQKEIFDKINQKLMEIYETDNPGKLAKIIRENTKPKPVKAKYNSEQTNQPETLPDMSVNQIYKKILEWNDPTLRYTFERMGWTEDTINELYNELSPQQIAWMNWQIEEFYPEYYKSVNEVYRKIFYVNLGFNPNYTPIARKVSAEQTGRDDDLLRNKNLSAFGSAYNTSLISRVNNSNELLFVDGDTILARHIVEMEHFKAWAEVIKEMRGVFGDRQIQEIIRQFHSSAELKSLNKMIDDLARGGVDRSQEIALLDKIRSNFVRSVLGANVTVTIKQLASFPGYAIDIPAGQWVKYTTGFLSNWKQIVPRMKTLIHGTFLQNRYDVGWERDVIRALQKTTPSKFSGKTSVTDYLMMATKLGDAGAIVTGGWAVYKYNYDQYIKQGISESKAKQKALLDFEKATRRMQQAGEPEDLPDLMRRGSVWRLFTMFMTAPNSYYRATSGAIRNLMAGRGSKTANLKRLAIAHFLLPAMFQFVASGLPGIITDWDDKDKKRMIRSLMLGSFNGLLIAGDFLEAAIDALYVDRKIWHTLFGSPVTRPLEKSVEVLLKISKLDELAMDGVLKVIDQVSETLSNFLGVPYGPIKRQIGGIYRYSTGETDEVLSLFGYSDYALGNAKLSEKKKVLRKYVEGRTDLLNDKGYLNEDGKKLLQQYEEELKQKGMSIDGSEKDFRLSLKYGFGNKEVALLRSSLKNDEKADYLVKLKSKINKNEFLDNYIQMRRDGVISDDLNDKVAGRIGYKKFRKELLQREYDVLKIKSVTNKISNLERIRLNLLKKEVEKP